MSRDNAGQRVLNARRTLRGNDDCLENTFGRTLPDGAQCFVLEEQANYRLVHSCAFPEDDRNVVMPKGDKFGRWVRAEGLVGFALLEGGKLQGDLFTGWTYQKLVQFEVTPEALVYVGSVPRLASFSALTKNCTSNMALGIALRSQGRAVATGPSCAASGVALVHPGESIVLNGLVSCPNDADAVANLQVILA